MKTNIPAISIGLDLSDKKHAIGVLDQCGNIIPRVDLGAEAKEKFKDIYDEYSLLRISIRSSA